jgi:hypothetical protein
LQELKNPGGVAPRNRAALRWGNWIEVGRV